VEVMSRNLSERTEENHKTPVHDAASYPIFKYETSRIQAKDKRFNIQQRHSAQVPAYHDICLFIFCSVG